MRDGALQSLRTMRRHNIEAWVIQVATTIRRGENLEDSLVELKADWPTDYHKAARRIAGHANASRSEPILWVVGLDEKNGVRGAGSIDVSAWYAQVSQFFEDRIPELTTLNVLFEDHTLVALYFVTDLPPYVVKNPLFGQPGAGPIEREVPWREATRVRTATRADLLKLLVPLERLPEMELLSGEVIASHEKDDMNKIHWRVSAEIYVTPRTLDRIVFPYHKCSLEIRIGDTVLEYSKFDLRSEKRFSVHSGTHSLSQTISDTPREIIVDGPGLLELRGRRFSDLLNVESMDSVTVTLKAIPAGFEIASGLSIVLPVRRKSYDQVRRWAINRPLSVHHPKKHSNFSVDDSPALPDWEPDIS